MRFPAARVFSVEITNTEHFEKVKVRDMESNVAVTPLGRKVGRIINMGTLLEVTDVGENSVRARIADTKGVYTVLAHEVYQPQAYAALKEAMYPCHVAVVGKIRKNGDYRAFVRPEFVAVVDKEDRDIWEKEAEESTMKLVERIETDEEYAKDVKEKYPNVDRVIAKLRGEEADSDAKEDKSEKMDEEDYEYVDLEELLDDNGNENYKIEVEEIDFTQFM